MKKQSWYFGGGCQSSYAGIDSYVAYPRPPSYDSTEHENAQYAKAREAHDNFCNDLYVIYLEDLHQEYGAWLTVDQHNAIMKYIHRLDFGRKLDKIEATYRNLVHLVSYFK
jgi:hypothetical protein